MEAKSIILFVIIIILLIIVISYVSQDVNTLTDIMSAQTMQKIEAQDMPSYSSSGNTTNFTYSIWFFIDYIRGN